MILIVVRMPEILIRGRFWAEEGTVFFWNIRHLPWYEGLFFVWGGYLNIIANAASLLAQNLVPLDYAPYASTGLALLIQTCPAILLCSSRSNWLQDRRILIAALLIVATQPTAYEIWLSSIGSQCHLNLCTAIILAIDPMTGLGGIFTNLLLLLAPLSGPGGSFLLPVFVGLAIIDRSKGRAIQALVLAIGAAIQFLHFVQFQARPFGVEIPLLLHIFYTKHLLEPLIGWQGAFEPSFKLRDAYARGHLSFRIMALTTCAFLIFGWRVIQSRRKESICFFCCGLILSILAYCGALGCRQDVICSGFGDRYTFAPQVCFELALLSLAFLSSGWTKKTCTVILVWALFIGMREYCSTPWYYTAGPSWHSEVDAWRKDKSHYAKIWPRGWDVNLNQTGVGGHGGDGAI
jgi:hypothetical protein